jgi:hypothetical protein
MEKPMPRLSKLQILQHVAPKIVNFFKSKGSNIYSISDMKSLLHENESLWMLPVTTTFNEFARFLINKNILKEVEIELPQRTVVKYVYGNISDYEIALSINRNSYCSHYTAMLLHNLTDNIPKNIYTNTEQTNKAASTSRSELKQENVDRAFSRPMRETNQVAQLEGKKIYLLNGKNVDNVGVTDFSLNDRILKVTNIERTLIDIVVRPNYAGGVQEILNAYIAAKGKCSVNKLISVLKKMDYTYPYHQAIGFYLERAGYSESVLSLVKKIEIKYNFYLTYQIKEKDFSERWKLFFPKGL